MLYTPIQKKILSFLSLSNLVFRKMFKDKGELGYTSKSKNFSKDYSYDINIAEDAPSKDIQDIVLIHELGHIYFGHVNKDINIEIDNIIKMLKDKGKTIDDFCRTYGGFMNFINLCMDFEVNSKLFTLSNIKVINEYFKICLPRNFKLPTLNHYSDYYEPLLEKIEHIDMKMAESDEDSNKDTNENNVPNDLPNRASYQKVSGRLKEILKKENYKEGSEKSKEKNIVGETLLKTFLEVNRKDRDDLLKEDSFIYENLKIENKIENRIKEFLRKIIDIEYSFKEDSLKHYNRGTRDRSSGILYKAIKLNHSFKNKKKLGIIVDVSSSMEPKDLLKAASTLKDYSNELDPGSLLITWNDRLVESFNIKKIPSNVKIGGGTELSSAIEYLAEKDFTDIVIYSDFETPHWKLEKVIKDLNSNVKIYTILVNNPKLEKFLQVIFKKAPILVL